jgi:PAS domain S-box-containing protein
MKPFEGRTLLKPEDYELIVEAIMRFSKDGLFVTDHEGRVVLVNSATEEMCDFRAEDVLGRNVRDLVREGFYDPSVSLLVLQKKQIISLIQTTHRQRRLLSTGVPIFNEAGRIRFVLVNDRDISALSSLIESLEADATEAAMLRFDLSELGLAASELEGLIIGSPSMLSTVHTAVRAAKFDIPLVITGESGVGKSLVARLVHRLSDRRHGPFMDLNCGAIAESLLESELFGHERGAFTGAAPSGKRGLFEMADQGTLFLDEIAEIPLALQAKLLKFLESGELIPVGGVAPRRINTRIIAATNRDLERMVAQGAFRSDLYFRLNVVPLRIPPLRERRDEIQPLVTYFLDRFNQEFGTRKIVSKSAREALVDYDFPGNVRELENLIKRLVTMTEGDYIRVKHLPELLRREPGAGDSISGPAGRYQEAVNAFELKIIQDAVRKYGSQRKAAEALGISQSTLSRKLKAAGPKHIVH